jgi:hypothetical protein
MYVPDMLDFLSSLWERGVVNPPQRVFEIGAQDVFINGFPESANRFVRALGGEVKPQSNPMKPLTARQLYSQAGCIYSCGDVIGDENMRYYRRLLDLNYDTIPVFDRASYDFVTSLGVSQHLMNQEGAFRAAHDLAEPGGVILHYVPSIGMYDDLYYYYQPALFQAIAEENGYEYIGLWAVVSGDHLAPRSIFQWSSSMIEAMRGPDSENEYFIWIALFRKKTGELFRSPRFTASSHAPRNIFADLSSHFPAITGLEMANQTALEIGGASEYERPIAASWKLVNELDFTKAPDGGSLGEDESYDVVLNAGVSQNALDQISFFTQMHNRTKAGGWMFHLVPFYGYSNHNWMAYDLSFFHELSERNGYEQGVCMYVTDGGWIRMDINMRNYLDLRLSGERGFHWCVVALRKTQDLPFCVPFQGRYISYRDNHLDYRYKAAHSNCLYSDRMTTHVPLRDIRKLERDKRRDVAS